MHSKSVLSRSGSGWANSTNSNPSVPAGFSALMVAGGASWGKGPMANTLRWKRSECKVTAVPPRSACILSFVTRLICTVRAPVSPSMHAISVDAFDLKLLDALQSDGSLTNGQLADRIGLSPSQCSRRRSALEAAGIVEGYRAELSATALGLD